MRKRILFVFLFLSMIALAACNTTSNESQVQNNAQPAYFTGIVTDISQTGCCMEITDAGNYGHLAVGTPVIVSTNIENCPDYAVGDYLRITFDGTVAESYPPQVMHVSAVEKTGSAPAEEVFDFAVSYTLWDDTTAIYTKALNTKAMICSSVLHLPIYKFDTLEELEQFKHSIPDSAEQSGATSPSFEEATAKCDAAFFNENSLILIYKQATGGAFRYEIDNIYQEDGIYYVHVVSVEDPEAFAADMGGWFICFAVSDSEVENCTKFDADLNNLEK